MKTKIAIVCAFVALVGGYIYYTGYIEIEESTNGDVSKTITESAFAPQNQNNMKGSGTFANLLGLKKNVVCDVSYAQTELNTQVSGKVYTNGENMRANFMMQGDGGPTETNMVNDGKVMYIWGKSNGTEMAMKFNIDEAETPKENQKQFDMNTDVDYSCENWNVDASVFVPPSNLTFMDMSSMMQGGSNGQPSAADMKAMQCSMCNQMTDASEKAECKAMLACI